MSRSRCFVVLALVLALSGCGGGDGSRDTPPSDIGTLAYVTTECHDMPGVSSEHQTLHILHGERDVAVMETPSVRSTGVGGLCRFLNRNRFGPFSVAREAFQGLAVSPDGAAVVFEVTDDFSPLPIHLPPAQKGIFFARADGSGLRLLGPPSRQSFSFMLNSGFTAIQNGIGFSPDGRMITFADKGPDAAGNDVSQVMTLDLGSGQRRQVTHLPPAVPPADRLLAPSVLQPIFIDNQTIGFLTYADPDGLNPTGNFLPFTVSLNDGTLKVPPIPVALPGNGIVPTFFITGDKPAAIDLAVSGQPQNHLNGITPIIHEVFVLDGPNLIQLTNFQRVDTGSEIVDVDRRTVVLAASADPLGTNPSENCQIFSIDRLGGSTRQLTQFRETQYSTSGCNYYALPSIVGCAASNLSQDSRTGTLIFYSSCDPLGTNPFGGQIFAMRPDGSGLRQLTHARGVVAQTGRLGINELPGPFAYGPYAP